MSILVLFGLITAEKSCHRLNINAIEKKTVKSPLNTCISISSITNRDHVPDLKSVSCIYRCIVIVNNNHRPLMKNAQWTASLTLLHTRIGGQVISVYHRSSYSSICNTTNTSTITILWWIIFYLYSLYEMLSDQPLQPMQIRLVSTFLCGAVHFFVDLLENKLIPYFKLVSESFIQLKTACIINIRRPIAYYYFC